ncbi:MAG TPA: hypothetical protein ENN94_04205 [Geoalkalibacter subterraneus]|uniref:Uncharacterized protein n=1 Tax=Geoalkalibacter subterraneus TaxID=483547 RepID=A0A831LHB2_9BACT|nr:hypothetical protein [Geoalkalibacter subterraneus]
MSSADTPTAGGHIESQCTKCGRVTNHTIVAMVEDTVVKVQCNTCEGTHKYRPPKAARTTKTKATGGARRVTDKAASAKKTTADQDEWQQNVRDRDSAAAVNYTMDGSFEVEDLVRHPTFGLGQVVAVFKPNKMEVLFEQGRKMLRCQL